MKIRLIIAFTMAAALTVGPALLEGHYLNRWGTPPDLTSAARQVESFPRDFGAWTFDKSGEPLNPGIIQELGLAGYISRTYVHHDSGSVVSLLLMVGQPGPLLRHPPNICYANRANVQVGEMTQFDVKATSPESEFNLLEYKPPQSFANDRFLVAYSMATEQSWQVPKLPRLEFGAAPKLYKVQLLIALDPSQDREKGMAILQQFANDFCTRFQQLTAAKL